MRLRVVTTKGVGAFVTLTIRQGDDAHAKVDAAIADLLERVLGPDRTDVKIQINMTADEAAQLERSRAGRSR